MPTCSKLNYAEPAVAEQIYRNKDSVVRHWLREPYAIDGWRLDVVHMLGRVRPNITSPIWPVSARLHGREPASLYAG